MKKPYLEEDHEFGELPIFTNHDWPFAWDHQSKCTGNLKIWSWWEREAFGRCSFLFAMLNHFVQETDAERPNFSLPFFHDCWEKPVMSCILLEVGLERKQVQPSGCVSGYSITLPKFNMEPENGTLE